MKRYAKREEGGSDDPVARDLQCFLNQPNINMIIPWVYEIYKSVRGGSGGSGGSGEGGGGGDDDQPCDDGYYWEDLN